MHLLTQNQKPEKKMLKKNIVFTHSLEFCPKVVKTNFSTEIKKYATFGSTLAFCSKIFHRKISFFQLPKYHKFQYQNFDLTQETTKSQRETSLKL